MPLKRCSSNGETGWKYGDAGKCYTGPGARAKAIRQMRAIKANLTAPRTVDPTRTGTLRAKAVAGMLRRMRDLEKAIYQLMVEDDAFGLNPRKLKINAPGEFLFLSDEGKLLAWQGWLQGQIDHGFVGPVPVGSFSWLDPFIQEAYQRATRRAWRKVKQPPGALPPQFRRAGQFGSGASVEASRLLYMRAYEQLKGITAEMSAKLSVIMAEAIAYGADAKGTAKRITEEIEGIGRRRALKLARTEIIYAYAEGALDSFEKLGVRGVVIDVELITAGDDRVCPICAALEGRVYTIAEARGVIPVHPQCRCAWGAAVGETRRLADTILASL